MEEKTNPGKDAVMDKESEDAPAAPTENRGPSIITTADRGVVQEPDVEYGVYEPNEDGLAVAVAVTEEDDDVFIPSAVEYDPDAKPPLHRNRRFRLYGFLAFFALMACAVGATIGIVLGGKGDSASEIELHPREQLGIRDLVTRLVGEEQVNRYNSPYKKAIDWIIYEDPHQLTPDDDRFVQRLIMAYFFYATSVDMPWKSCNPPNTTLEESSSCFFEKLFSLRPPRYSPEQAVRWLSGTHECEWVGVQCDRAMQVRSINLAGQEMTGPFPDGIVHLPLLQSITVPLNKWRGSIPSEMATMKHLVNFEVHFNELSGNIPEEIWDMKNLIRLNVGGNKMTGSLSTKIGNLRDLKGIFVYGNQITGKIPTEVGKLASLTYFRVSENLMTGKIPTELSELKALEEIWISDNNLSGELPSNFFELPNLRDVRMRRNPLLTGRWPDSFWDIDVMSYVDIRQTNFTGSISEKIGNMSTLINFRIANTRFTGPIPTVVAQLPLQSLWVQNTDMTGDVPTEICEAQDFIKFKDLVADCLGDTPDQPCACCTGCCSEEGGCLTLE